MVLEQFAGMGQAVCYVIDPSCCALRFRAQSVYRIGGVSIRKRPLNTSGSLPHDPHNAGLGIRACLRSGGGS